jgi:hypothetical protein
VTSLLVAAGISASYYRAHVPQARPISVMRAPFAAPADATPAPGPLRVLPANPRYFTADGETAILLVGSHTWSNLQDSGHTDPPEPFDYGRYLDFLVHQHHNFFKMWIWEQARWAPWLYTDRYFNEPLPYVRSGPGLALDGKPRFDLDRFNEAYFDRLRDRVRRAGDRGIYVAVMLFDAWSLDNRHGGLNRGNPWLGHPFNRANNINGIDGDGNGDGQGGECHQLVDPRITAYQDRYVERVIEAVGDLDNVLYEISNESWPDARDWEYHVIDHVHRYEATRPKRHPVGMTSYVGLKKSFERDLFESHAEWIAPNNGLHNEYIDAPPPASGAKVVVLDTDHLWGIGGDRTWAWKAFLRGYNLLFMDSYDGHAVGLGAPAPWDIRFASWREIVNKVLGRFDPPAGWDPDNPTAVELRASMGDIRGFSQRLPLARMTPHGELASTGYCLFGGTAGDSHYLALADNGSRRLRLDLTATLGTMDYEIFDTRAGVVVKQGRVEGGSQQEFGIDGIEQWVVHVHSGGSGVTAPFR